MAYLCKKFYVMAELTFDKIRVADLDQRLIDSIRAFFQNQHARVSITVKEESAQPEITISLSELLARNAADDVVYQVPSEEFDKIVRQFEADETFDPVAAIEKFAVHRQPFETV
jgi:hypothetical protein